MMDRTVYFCAYENCSAKFKKSYKLQCHQRLHSGERPYVCDFEGCTKSYTQGSHLTRHKETHSTSIRCTVKDCSEVFTSKCNLQRHLSNYHGGEKPKTYKCTLCDKEFNKHNWLTSHMFQHTGQLPYKCSVEECDQAFLYPSRLKRHMKYHKGYPCGTGSCDQVFTHWSFLVKHKKECHPVVHPCDECGKVFSCTPQLKSHSLVHKSERTVFECEFPNCTRFYTQKKNLVHHVKYFHNRRPFNCTRENCHRAFKTEAERTKHLLHHDSRKPIKKRKKKPSFAAKLAGCASPTTTDRKSEDESTVVEASGPTEEAPVKKRKAESLPDYVTVTVSVSEMEKPADSKSCLAIFEGILNGSFLTSEPET